MRPLASRDVLGAPLRRLHRALGGACVVLTYHRVAEEGPDPQLLGVTPERFGAHMATIARECTPVSASRLAEHITTRRPLPPRAVAVTFDDGYAGNLTHALPSLRAHGVPATVFVTSGFVGSPRLAWIDELEDLILRPESLPARLRVAGPDGEHTYDLDAEAGRPADPAWDITQPPTGPRTTAYLTLAARLLGFTPAEREAALIALRTQTGLDPRADERRRMLSAAELGAIASDDLVTIGCHTARHPRLAALSVESQRQEIAESRAALEEATGRPVTLFAYPYGGRDDYTDETAAEVRRAGFDAAFTTRYGAATPYSDRWRIPRVSVSDRDGDALALVLSRVLASGR